MKAISLENIRQLRSRPTFLLSAILGLAMVGLAWFGVVYHLQQERSFAIEAARQNTGNLARTFEQQTIQIVTEIDWVLSALQAEHVKNPEQFDVDSLRRPRRGEWSQDFSFVDSKGIIRVASRKRLPAQPVDVSDRDYFRAHVDDNQVGLFISKPTIGRVTGKNAIVFSRRLAGADGTFAGVVIAFVYSDTLVKFYETIDVGRNGAIALWGTDGVLYASRGLKQDKYPPHRPNGLVLGELAKGPAGFYTTTGQMDGNVRLVSFRKVASFPFVVTVGLAEREVLTHYLRDRGIFVIVGAQLTFIVLIFIGFIAVHERRLAESARARQESDERLAQANLERIESDARYQAAFESSSVGMGHADSATGRLTRVNRSFCEMTGYDEAELVGRSFLEITHPDDIKRNREGFKCLVRHEIREHRIEKRYVRKDGRIIWVDVTANLVFGPDGRPIDHIAIVLDISERKRAEAALIESRNNLARAERIAQIGHYEYDSRTDTYVWSDGVYCIFGNSPESFNPTLRNIVEFVHPDDRPALEDYRKHLFEGLDNSRLTLRLIRSDGQIIHVQLCSTPLRSGDGTVVGFFGTIQDVSLRKQAEDLIARENERLEQLVAERTAKLQEEMRMREDAQATLWQAQKMEAVGQLTAGVAHDFNNLLAVIHGGLTFIKRAAKKNLPADEELINAGLRASERGSDLVKRLLAFSRQAPLLAAPALVDRLVLDTLRLLQRTLEKDIEFEVKLNAVSAIISVDSAQFANALINLAVNARDAMPDGGHLTISTVCQKARWFDKEGPARWPTGEEVCITVSDTGHGMSEDVRNRAMEPFFTTKPHGVGSGLGLSMVHGFVEQSGGHMEIESEVGQGTTVVIRLPRIDAASMQDQAEGNAAAVDGENRIVLLVEDDIDVRAITAAQLKQLGYKVHAVANGQEALDLIVSPASFDIILTDIILPSGVDGITLLKEAMRARPAMGVLCMTGYAPMQRHVKWLKAQNIKCLEKPFSAAQLTSALDSVIVR